MSRFVPRHRFLYPLLFTFSLMLAALSTTAFAQDDSAPAQSPAPIVHQYPPARRVAPQPLALTSPAPGMWVRSSPGAQVKTVSSAADSIELRVDKGLANITLSHPKENEQILVDLPGGQVALVKDGTYTFNATTNTFRVLDGEAAAFPSTDLKAKPLTVKGDHAVVFGSGNLRSTEFAPFQAQADILPAGPSDREPGYRSNGYYGRSFAYGPYGYYGPYGDGYYPYPYYAWGYPYGPWGYPYGFGLGIGFGGYWGGGFGRGFGGFRR